MPQIWSSIHHKKPEPMDRYCLGIDVDKKLLKCCLTITQLGCIKIKASRTFDNSPSGFLKLSEWSEKHRKEDLPMSVVMEATGVYHEKLAYFLSGHPVAVHVVLPSLAKHYIRSLGQRSKTDAMDARGLAYMGCQQSLEAWSRPSKAMAELRSLTRQIEALQEHRTALLNQGEAIEHASVAHRQVAKSNRKVLEVMEKEIDRLKKLVASTVKNDQVLSDKYTLFTELKGVGILTFAVLASETDGLAMFKSQSQLVSYSGYDVVENQSGKRAGKTKISKKGNTHIRRILHMAAMTAVSNEMPVFRQLYERVYGRTLIKMKGYVAVQRKLLSIFYTIWTKDEPFDPHYGQEGKAESGIKEPSPSLREKKMSAKIKAATPMEAAALDRLRATMSPEPSLR